jgi:hypothetical protein
MSNLSASAIVNGPVLGEGYWGSPNLTGRDFNLLDSALGHRWGDWAYGGLVSPEWTKVLPGVLGAAWES